MKTERTDYLAFALRGFDAELRRLIPRNDILAIGCHKGVRRSRAAIGMLIPTGIPIANDPRVSPNINYADFLENNFTVTQEGLTVPEKTIYPFQSLLLFHDGSKEEIVQVRNIREILRVEASGILNALILAEQRDQEGFGYCLTYP